MGHPRAGVQGLAHARQARGHLDRHQAATLPSLRQDILAGAARAGREPDDDRPAGEVDRAAGVEAHLHLTGRRNRRGRGNDPQHLPRLHQRA